MKNTLSTVMSILILIVLAAGVYFIVETVRDAAAATTAPIEQVNEANYALQTQVAQMMNPTPTIIPDPVTYINEIRALARLETIEYSISQVVSSETNQDSPIFAFAFGSKILVQIHGSVIAGIDMEKMQPTDLRYQDGVLYAILPPAEILAVTLDEDRTEVYTVQEGLFVDVDPNLVLDVIGVGEDKIVSVAIEDGILVQAQENAEAYLYKFFNALGFKSVIFE